MCAITEKHSIKAAHQKFLKGVFLCNLVVTCGENRFCMNISMTFAQVFSFDCYIRSEISDGNNFSMLLLDVQKAFDSANHGILCSKLSDFQKITSGVP